MLFLFRTRGRSLPSFCTGTFPPRTYKRTGIARFSCISFLLLTLLPVSAFPQATGTAPISNADNLFSELLSIKTEEHPKALELIKDHKNLITPQLWIRLINESTRLSDGGNTARSLFVLELAKDAAEQLDDRKLLAQTFYRIGISHIARNEFKAALDAYLLSKKYFEEANSPRDVISVLSEMGELAHFYGRLRESRRVFGAKSCAGRLVKKQQGTCGSSA